MKFLPQEQQALMVVLRRFGFAEQEVLFVKRRGKVHVSLVNTSSEFHFHRKERTSLDESGQWVKSVEYYYLDQRNPCDWGQVVDAFATWLNEVRS